MNARPVTLSPPDTGVHRTAARVVAGAAWALAAIALVLFAVARPDWTSDQWYFVVDLADAVVYGLVASLLLRTTRHPVSWILSITAVGGGLAAVSFQWLSLWVENPDLYGGRWLLSASGWAWVPGTVMLMVVVPYLVRRGPLPIPASVAVGLGLGVTALLWITRLTDPTPLMPDGGALAPLPMGGDAWMRFIEASFPWLMRAVVVLGLFAVAEVGRRWAGTAVSDRRGLGWLTIGAFLVTVSFVPLALPESWSAQLPVAFTPLTHLASQAFFPAAILVAVLGQRLWGIELAVSRTLTWALLTAAAVASYLALVAVLDLVVPASGGSRMIATALVVAGAQPGLAWIRQRVDRLVYGDAGAPLQVVDQVTRHLDTGSGAGGLLAEVLEGLAGSLRLSHAAIHASADGDAVAAFGTAGGELVAVPLRHRGRQLGLLRASGRMGERLDARTVRTIEQMAPVIAAAFALAVTTRELAESRARLTDARDDERRMLRRELHDEVGPALAGIGLGLKAGRNLLTNDPDGAARLLDSLVGEIDGQVERIRTLAHGLVPPALEDHGLGPALDGLAERYQMSGLQVDVELGSMPALGVQVESALYAIASEAVRNAYRHGTPSRCLVSVDVDGPSVTLAVIDDGTGIAPEARPGVGMRSMRERAEALGGVLSVEPTGSGGTAVRVSVPRSLERIVEVTS